MAAHAGANGIVGEPIKTRGGSLPASQQFNFSEFTRGLAESGWVSGSNIQMEVRWIGGDIDLMRKLAKELVALKPDVILANSTPVTAALQRETQTIPIVFAIVGDPIGSGFVVSLYHFYIRVS